jgi:hypothetical protein
MDTDATEPSEQEPPKRDEAGERRLREMARRVAARLEAPVASLPMRPVR